MAEGRLSLFPVRPKSERPSAIEKVEGERGATRQSIGLWATLFGAIGSQLTPGRAARQVCTSMTLRQVFYTGFEALPLVSVIAVFVGVTIVMQMQLMNIALPGELVGKALVAMILRELAPLTTATIIASRSGTAMATELGNMKANAEMLALSSLGIDPLRFVVWPRLVATVVSVMVLTIYFGVIAIITGYFLGTTLGLSSFWALQAGFAEAIQPHDFFLYLFKCTGLGVLVGWLCCHYGLQVQASPTEVPEKAARAVVLSLVACVVYNAVVTAGFYWIVGPPVQ